MACVHCRQGPKLQLPLDVWLHTRQSKSCVLWFNSCVPLGDWGLLGGLSGNYNLLDCLPVFMTCTVLFVWVLFAKT
jgi:hypothetical protein